MLAATLAFGVTARAATITVVNLDGVGEGFNDTTPVAPVGGNPGTTLGAQRLNAFQFAADIWGVQLVSAVPILVGAEMNVLFCNSTSAVLGQAGPNTIHRDFSGALVAGTWYAQALANKLNGSDLAPGTDDIGAEFNSAIGTTCSFPNVWYYGFDASPPGSDIDFVSVVLHEIGHGLGFLSLVDDGSGAKFLGFDDAYMRLLEDHSIPMLWPPMTDGQRAASAIDTNDLHWTGAAVVANAGYLSSGVGGGGHVEMYAPNPLEPGSSVSHFSTSLFPNEIMEPIYTGPLHATTLCRHLMTDIGWGAGTPPTTSTTSTTTSSTSSTTTTTLASLCAATPATGCRLGLPLKSSILLKDDVTDDAKDQFKWKWNKGAATDVSDFADPVNGSATYRVCLYDGSGNTQPLQEAALVAGGTCGTVPCWKLLGSITLPKGYKFKNRAGLPQGLTDAKLQAGVTDKAKVQVKGKGLNLAMPLLGLTPPVTVQLLVDDGFTTECWQSTFTTFQVNTPTQFKAKGP